MNLKPNKVQLDVLKRHIGPFIFCFFTVMFLLLMQFLILYIDRLISKGLALSVILELIVTNLAYMVVLAAPMAVLVASLMAFGKFSELNEMTALRAAGVNPIRVINPVLVAAGILSLVLVWFSNDVLPNANQRARSLFLDIRTKKPGFNLKENEFYKGIDGYTFLVKNITSDSDSLHDVTLFQEASANKNRAIINARRGYLESPNKETMTLHLFNGSTIRYLYHREDHQRKETVEKTAFDRYRITFDLSKMAFSRSNPSDHSRNDRTMDVQAMMAVVDTLKREVQSARQKVFTRHTYTQFSAEKKEPRFIGSQRAKIQTKPPRESRYLMLRQDTTRSQQNQSYRAALNELRSYRSAYENLSTTVTWRTNRISKYWVEIYKKFSLPIACFIFVLVGAPIGIYTKKGNLGYAALIGTGFLTFFWISIIQGEKLADRLIISPFTGMWFSDILLAVVGSIMLIQLCTTFKISNLWNFRD